MGKIMSIKVEVHLYSTYPRSFDKNDSPPPSRTAVFKNDENIEKHAFLTQPKECSLDINVRLLDADRVVADNIDNSAKNCCNMENKITKAANSTAVKERAIITLENAVAGMVVTAEGVLERGDTKVISLTKKQLLKHLKEDASNMLIRYYAASIDADEVVGCFAEANINIEAKAYNEGDVFNGVAATGDGYTYEIADVKLSKQGVYNLVLPSLLKAVNEKDPEKFALAVLGCHEKAEKLAEKLSE